MGIMECERVVKTCCWDLVKNNVSELGGAGLNASVSLKGKASSINIMSSCCDRTARDFDDSITYEFIKEKR